MLGEFGPFFNLTLLVQQFTICNHMRKDENSAISQRSVLKSSSREFGMMAHMCVRNQCAA